MNVKHKVQNAGTGSAPPTPQSLSQKEMKESFLSALGMSESSASYQDYLDALGKLFSGLTYSDVNIIVDMFKAEMAERCVFMPLVTK